STCGEALDAVAAVVALALSSQTPATTPAVQEHRESEPQAPRVVQQMVPRNDSGATTKSSARSWRLLAGLGVDVGTVARPTLLVAGGGALALGRAELR